MHTNIAALLFLLAPLAPAQVVISEIDLASSRVELVNIGTSDVNLTGYRWCNRFNGTPFYPGTLSTGAVNASFTTATGLLVKPGEIITFNQATTLLPPAGGELGVYKPSSFGGFSSRAAMADYINWGTSSGIRDSQAVQSPAIWVLNTAIAVSGASAGETIQLNPGAPGNAVGDYHLAAGTLGVAQSLAPVVVEITDAGLVDADTFFTEFSYNGGGSLKVTESTSLEGPFTDVQARTAVFNPSPGRFQFDIAGEALFFRIEEE